VANESYGQGKENELSVEYKQLRVIEPIVITQAQRSQRIMTTAMTMTTKIGWLDNHSQLLMMLASLTHNVLMAMKMLLMTMRMLILRG
jgi:hypothetical protein